MICDFNDMYFTTIDVAKRARCPACEGALPKALGERLVWLCGQRTANINPEVTLKLDLEEVCSRVEALALSVRVKSRLALMFDYKGLEVSLFSGGRMLIKNVSSEAAALKAYREVSATLGLASG
jgi:hypothetical protein